MARMVPQSWRPAACCSLHTITNRERNGEGVGSGPKLTKSKKIISMRFPHITLLNLPHFCFLSVAVPLSAMAAESQDFSGDQIAAIWREVWKTGEPKIKEPEIEKLAEGDVVQRMAGTWTDIWALMISLSGNRLVEV